MQTAETSIIDQEIINEAMSYGEYRELIDGLLEDGKTTGENQSEALTEYTQMNVHRMNRLDKHTELKSELKDTVQDVDESWIWLILTEGWCGDAAQNIPVIQKMADESDNITTRYILRDEYPEVMDEYLTNGGRSIPKLVCLHADSLEEIGTWGPRPKSFQQKALEWKDDPDISMKEWAERLHKKYAKDETEELQQEFKKLLEKWAVQSNI